jgi:hypothetical protein
MWLLSFLVRFRYRKRAGYLILVVVAGIGESIRKDLFKDDDGLVFVNTELGFGEI